MRFSKNTNDLTYGMILREFKDKNPEIEIVDYRPCCELFGFPCIKNAIIIWMKSGTKIVYKSEKKKWKQKQRWNFLERLRYFRRKL